MSTVVIALIEHKGRFAMLQRQDGRWVFASGKVDPGETIEEAVLREAIEETGLEIELKSNLGSKAHKGNKGDHILNYFSASVIGGELMLGEPDMFQQAIWATPQEVLHYKKDDLPDVIIRHVEEFIQSATELSLDRG